MLCLCLRSDGAVVVFAVNGTVTNTHTTHPQHQRRVFILLNDVPFVRGVVDNTSKEEDRLRLPTTLCLLSSSSILVEIMFQVVKLVTRLSTYLPSF